MNFNYAVPRSQQVSKRDMPTLSAAQICTVFNRAFKQSHATYLKGGQKEPFYQAKKMTSNKSTVNTTSVNATPVNENTTAIIFFTHDYASSALHECAHWCVAGKERRKKDDYGYWYSPDGRTVSQQKEFEQVEVKPQALEWIFSKAANIKFNVSADNLALSCGPSETFKKAIYAQVKQYLEAGLPNRARVFVLALMAESGIKPFTFNDFSYQDIA